MPIPPFVNNSTCLGSDVIYQRLRSQGRGIDGLDRIDSVADRHRLAVLLNSSGPELDEMAGIPYVETGGAHDVTYGKSPAGDLYYVDMLAGLGATEGKVLDFGCSTGRVIRNLKAAFPEIDAYGCDPRAESIELARSKVPDVSWFVSNEAPPLDVEVKFDTIFAISVWSHFSEARALTWFEEMRRHIQPDGALIFSTHGLRSVHHLYRTKKAMAPEWAVDRLFSLALDQVHFLPYRDTDLDSHWGIAFLPPAWVERIPDWKVDSFFPGLAMANQDVYVLVPD